jgi:putative membrane protein
VTRIALSLVLATGFLRCTPEQAVHPRPHPSKASDASALAPQDRDFLERAAEGNNGEVAMGRLAQMNGGRRSVIEYGRMMVADHGAAQNRLAAVAHKHRISLPTSLGEHQAAFDRIADLKKEEFDTEFMKVMREDHQKALLLYESEARSGVDPMLVGYAKETLPTIQAHFAHAKGLAGQ